MDPPREETKKEDNDGEKKSNVEDGNVTNISSQSLSQLERDILSKQAAANVGKPPSQPGAAGVRNDGTAAAVRTLSQVERDILTKQTAQGSSGATRPGVVSVGPMPTQMNTNAALSNSSQLERDIMSKQDAGGKMKDFGITSGHSAYDEGRGNANIKSTSEMSQIERDMLAKQNARPREEVTTAHTGLSPGAAKLSQVEQDVLSKQAARGFVSATRPGVVSVTTKYPPNNDISSLTQLERDVLAKRQALGMETSVEEIDSTHKGYIISGKPLIPAANGVGENVHDNNGNLSLKGLSQVERDILTKQTAQGSNAATRPGVVSVGPMPTQMNTNAALSNSSQLERDLMSKQDAGGKMKDFEMSSRHSAYDEGRGNGNIKSTSEMSQIERDMLAKQNARPREEVTTAHAGPSPGTAKLSQVENDVLSKQAARGFVSATRPGVVSVTSEMSQIERDMLAKQNARPREEVSAHAGPSPGAAKLSQVEQDVLSKQAARGYVSATRPGVVSVTAKSPSNNNTSSLTQLERDVLAKRQALGMEMSIEEVDSTKSSANGVAASVHSNNDNLTQLERDIRSKQLARGSVEPDSTSLPGAYSALPHGNTEGLKTNAVENSSNLTQLERDVLTKQNIRQSGAASTMSHAGAFSANGQDHRSLQTAQNNSSTDNSSSINASVSQLERDVRAKQAARGDSISVARPGAFAATQPVAAGNTSDNQLSQVERDVLLKQSVSASRTPSTNVSDSGRTLFVLENDVLAKQTARGISAAVQPGVQRVEAPAVESIASQAPVHGEPSTMSQLERDVVAKQNARNSMIASNQPGVAASYQVSSVSAMESSGVTVNDPNLSRLERDIIEKQNARGPVSSHTSSLSQVETDVLSKSQAAYRASQPGVVASSNSFQSQQGIEMSSSVFGRGSTDTTDVPSSLTQLEQDIASKTRCGPNAVSQPGAHAASSVSQLEMDIAMKSQGGNVGGSLIAPPPGSLKAPPPGSYAASDLNRMEQDVLAKNQARNSMLGDSNLVVGYTGQTDNSAAAASSLNQLEQDLMLKNSLKAPPASFASYNSGAVSSLNQFEADVLRNNGTYSAPNDYYGSNVAYSKPNAYDEQRQQYGTEYSNRSSYEQGVSLSSVRELEMRATSQAGSIATDPFVREYDYGNQYSAGSSVPSNEVRVISSDAAASANVALAHPEAPLSYPTHADSVDALVTEVGGIEAFVAENVIDATGVAVIMSDEEEAILEKKRQRRFFCFGGCCVLITVIVIIVALTTRSSSPAAIAPTESPTFAPTFSPTFSPTASVIPDAVNALSAYSNVDDLTNRNSPQFKSMDWLVSDDQFVSSEGLTFTDQKWIQRYLLGVFYFQFGGDEWNKCSRNDASCLNAENNVQSWLSDTDECTWFLLGCEDGVLSTMNFLPVKADREVVADIWLVGAMPNEISFLTGLVQFIFPPMGLLGEVLPLLSNMSKLEILTLPGQNFTGSILPVFSANYPNLKKIELDDNNFWGSIPSSVASLSGLSSLVLSRNNLTGVLPSELGDLVSLATLEIANNKFVGPIPSSLYRAGIKILNFGGNADIYGFIPDEIGSMSNLEVFAAGQTKMNGVVPTSIYSLANLTTLDLSSANFTGEIAEEISQLNNTLIFLSLNNNRFSGSIPSGIAVLNVLEVLNLQDNDLSGSIPQSLCERRGYGPQEIQILKVDCDVVVPCINDNDAC